jgi:hypothetical protein
MEAKDQFNANDIYKSIIGLLKNIEKDYNFNAIDPIDEERDHVDLKHKLLQLEKHREQMNAMGFRREDRLTQEDQAKIANIQSIKDLNEIKLLENRVIKLLKTRDIEINPQLPHFDPATLDLSDEYYKGVILKARGKMMDKKMDLLNLETEYNSKKKEFYQEKLDQLETDIFGNNSMF